MDNFKIEIFAKENPSNSFPVFSTLDAESTANIGLHLANKLNITTSTDGSSLLKTLLSQMKSIKYFNASVDNFSIKDVFVYLDWA